MFPSLDLQYSFHKVFYRNPVHLYKPFLLTTNDQYRTSALVLQTAPDSDIYWYYTFIFLLSESFRHIVTTGASMSSKFALDFSTLSLGATDFLGNGPIILDDMIFLLDIIQKTYWIQTQFMHLIVQSKSKPLLSIEVVNFIPKTPHSGLGQSLTLTGYSSGLTQFI